MTYYATYAGLLFAAYVGRTTRDIKRLAYWVLLVGLFLFSAYRYEVGCDWTGYLFNYLVEFQSYQEAFARREPGHWSLIHFLHQQGLSYQYLNVATSAIFFVGLHAIARRQPDPLAFLVLCFPILIINMPMSAIRQAAAIGFMCLAFNAFVDRRLLLYVAWILIGAAFHSSILLFLLFAPFVIGKFNRTNVIFGLILATPGAFLLGQSEPAQVAQVRYIDTGLDAAGAAFRLGILTLSGVFFFYKLAPVWQKQFPKDFKLAAIGSLAMIGFFSLFFVSSVVGDRFGYYLIPIQAMIFARIPYLPLGKSRKLFAVAPYAAITVVFLVWTQLSYHFNQCYLPYQIRFG